MPRRRESVGTHLRTGRELEARSGRARLCDSLPLPGDRVWSLRRTGDYYFFGDDRNIEDVLDVLSEQESEYTLVSPIFFSLDEALNEEKDVPDWKLEYDIRIDKPDSREYLWEGLRERDPIKYKSEALVYRRYLTWSLNLRWKGEDSQTVAVYKHEKKTFETAPTEGTNLDAFVRILARASQEKRGVAVPFESVSILSGHMCTMYMVPSRRGAVDVHVYDPNGKVPSYESAFPYCRSYRAAVESAVKALFARPEMGGIEAFVYFRSIPNFNIPGVRPRRETKGPSSSQFDDAAIRKRSKGYKGAQMDTIVGVAYHREDEGICVVSSLWVLTMLICYGGRALHDDWWVVAHRNMSHGRVRDPVRSRNRASVNLNDEVKQVGDIVIRVYNRLMYVRSFATHLYDFAVPSKFRRAFPDENVEYDKTTGRILEG